jgi:hypothetical protein
MASKILHKKTEFYNGILLICASGLGQDLQLPEVWGQKGYAHTKNAVLVDFREYGHDSVQVTVYLVPLQEEFSREGLDHIGNFVIDIPKGAVYIGDISRQTKAIIELGTNRFNFDLLYRYGDGGLNLYLVES